MSARLECALGEAFKRQHGREVLVMLTLYVSRIVGASYRNLERKFGFKRALAADVCASRRRLEAPREAGQVEQEHWDWRDIPPLWPALKGYEILSNIYMTSVIVKNVFSTQLEALIGLLQPPLPAHCYLFGHIAIHEAIDKYCAILFSSFHLSWRTLQYYAKRNYHPSLCFFMLISDHDLDKFARMLEEHNRRVVSRWRHSRRSSVGPMQEQPPVGEAGHAAGHGAPVRNEALGELDKCRDNFFKNILCYKVERGSCLLYKLRPNRTRAARGQLQARAATVVHWALLVFACLIICTAAINVFRILEDHQYLSLYPDCDQELERRRRAGELGSWSLTLNTPHRWLSLSIDLLENFIILFDSGLACVAVWPTVYLLNFDLLLYWRNLDRRFKCTSARIRARYGESGRRRPSAARLLLPTGKVASKLGGHAKYLGRERFSHMPMERVDDMDLNDLIYDLQAECCDFFAKIRETDGYISDMITGTVCVWLASFSVLGHFSLNHYLRSDDLLLVLTILAGLISGFLLISIASFNLLSLHRNCLKSYMTICSMMAYDQSQHKRGYLKLMEFYTVKKRSAYTLFQQYPYTSTTYMSVFGWSLSCFFILDGLTRHRQGWI